MFLLRQLNRNTEAVATLEIARSLISSCPDIEISESARNQLVFPAHYLNLDGEFDVLFEPKRS